MSFDDPLIDLDVKDLIDIVRVYSSYSKKEEKALFVPTLFTDSADQS